MTSTILMFDFYKIRLYRINSLKTTTIATPEFSGVIILKRRIKWKSPTLQDEF